MFFVSFVVTCHSGFAGDEKDGKAGKIPVFWADRISGGGFFSGVVL
jgi:hypothetical protein